MKLRLGHAHGRSLLVPDVLIAAGYTRYFLPTFFGPPHIAFDEKSGEQSLTLDLDVHSERDGDYSRLLLKVDSRDLLRVYDDGAQLYRCVFNGPRQIARRATGLCSAMEGGDYALRVFHHTTREAAGKIVASGELWASQWNLAGTRTLENVAYGYFTSLSRIRSEQDLNRIAMASGGELAFQTTSEREQEDVLRLRVYRGNTADRTEALAFNVPCAVIAPAHLRFHPAMVAYYEVIGPEIVRVGVKPGTNLSFAQGDVAVHAENLKQFDYIVLGNASTIDGLAAPYNEEETDQVVHLERFEEGVDLFKFWQTHQNTDLVAGREFEKRIVEPPKPLVWVYPGKASL